VTSRLRVLISAFGATGHVFPGFALARQLDARGHRVMFESLERWREATEGLGLEFFPAPEYVAFPRPWPGKPDRPTLPEVVRALVGLVRDFRPDVIVNDFFTLPAALAAEMEGVRRAALVPHPYPVNEPGLPYFMMGALPPRTPLGAAAWRAGRPWFERLPRRERGELNEARRELGLRPEERLYGGLSESLSMVATFPQLEYPRRWPHYAHVTGPMLFELPHPPVELPSGSQPLVLVAGSTAQDQELDLVRVALAALADEPVRVLAALNQKGRRWEGPVPANARVVDWASYAQVMPEASAVVCNGGHGTIARALAEGVPVLVCPGPGDMKMNGAHLAWSGAGSMLPRRLLAPGPLRWAVRRLLADPRIASRSGEIAVWASEHDGAAIGATLLERSASAGTR
jgi:UDP:flavonoid glycosyltransferase YjiC (YdhE family)